MLPGALHGHSKHTGSKHTVYNCHQPPQSASKATTGTTVNGGGGGGGEGSGEEEAESPLAKGGIKRGRGGGRGRGRGRGRKVRRAGGASAAPC